MDNTMRNPKKINNIHLGAFKGDTIEVSFDITDQNNKDLTIQGTIRLSDLYRTLAENDWLQEDRKVA